MGTNMEPEEDAKQHSTVRFFFFFFLKEAFGDIIWAAGDI